MSVRIKVVYGTKEELEGMLKVLDSFLKEQIRSKGKRFRVYIALEHRD